MSQPPTKGPWTPPRLYRRADRSISSAVVYGGGAEVPASAGLRPIFALANPKDEDLANLQLASVALELRDQLERAVAMIDVHAATARSLAKTQNEKANLGLADELTMHAQSFRRTLAKAAEEIDTA